jgi:integrase/recombinase XerC
MDLFEASAYHLAEVRRVRGHEDPNHPTLRLYGLYERRHLAYLETNHLEPRLDMLNEHTVGGCQLWIREEHGIGKRNGRQAEAAYVQIVKIWSRFLFKRRVIPQDLLQGFEKPHVPQVLRRPFSREEVERLYAVAGDSPNPERDKAVLLLLADTGCRIGELCGLDLDDVIGPDGTLRGSIRFKKTKFGVPRDVLIAARDFVDGGPSMAALRSYLRVRKAPVEQRALFVTSGAGQPWSVRDVNGGNRLSPRRVRELLRLWGTKGHVDNAHPHRFRHTAATELLSEGASENSIRDRLGHMSPGAVHGYLHQNARLRDIAAEKASLSSKWNLGQAPGANDLSLTSLKHDVEDLLRSDPAAIRQLLKLAASLKPTGDISA